MQLISQKKVENEPAKRFPDVLNRYTCCGHRDVLLFSLPKREDCVKCNGDQKINANAIKVYDSKQTLKSVLGDRIGAHFLPSRLILVAAVTIIPLHPSGKFADKDD